MRDAVIDGEFEHLRIDHDQPALIRPQPIDQAQDHGVDGDRFAGAGGAGDQHMRRARQIDDDGFAADVLAEAERQFRVRLVLRGQQLAQVDLLAMHVRQFDADGVAAGDHGDARRERAHRAGDIVGEADDARGFDAGRRLEFVQRHDRAGIGLDDLAADAEIAEHAFERARIGLQLGLAERLPVRRLGRRQHRDRRQFELFGFARRRARRGLLARRAGGRGFLFLLLVFLLFFFLVFDSSSCGRQRRRGAAAEARFLTFERGRARRRRARHQRAVGRAHQPAEPRLRAHQRVIHPAERNRAAILLLPRTACRRPRSASALHLRGREPQPLANRKVAHIAANRMMPSTRR